MGAKMQQWMVGRYGYDELSRAMFIAAVVCMVLACIPSLQLMYIPAIVLWVWSMFRCYSRNLEKRRAERAAHLQFTGRIKAWFGVKKKAWKDVFDPSISQ